MQKLVIKSISLAIARDGASGGVVRTVTVRTTSFFNHVDIFNGVLFPYGPMYTINNVIDRVRTPQFVVRVHSSCSL